MRDTLMLANRQQTCSIFGWSSREFDKYCGLGLPAKKKSGSKGEIWQLDTVEVTTWLVNRAVAAAIGEQGAVEGPGALDVNEQRARLLKHQANLAALQEDKLRGSLVDADEIRRALAALDIAVRDRLLAVPMAVADLAFEAGQRHGAAGIAETYRRAVHDALVALASAEVVSSSAPPVDRAA